MNIKTKEYYLTPNPYSRPMYKIGNIKGIIIHWTGNPKTTAENNRNYFNNRKYGRVICKDCNKEVYAYELHWDNINWRCRSCNSKNLKYQSRNNFVSTHYIIGLEGEIIQTMPLTELSYHTGIITNTETIKILGYKPNKNTIGIECCISDNEGNMSRLTYNSIVDLTVYLMQLYNLNPMVNLFLHYHIYGKNCHKYFVDNIAEWESFKILVQGKL